MPYSVVAFWEKLCTNKNLFLNNTNFLYDIPKKHAYLLKKQKNIFHCPKLGSENLKKEIICAIIRLQSKKNALFFLGKNRGKPNENVE